MKIYTLERRQILPISLDDAWAFFSNPSNLKQITPPSMDFRVTSHPAPEMYAGMIITYTVRPMLGILVRWVTEITHVKEYEFFVDEQRFGPYSFWHHQHRFETVEGGTLMTDIIHYKLPLGILGSIAGRLIVNRQLDHIFGFRKTVLEKIFSNATSRRTETKHHLAV